MVDAKGHRVCAFGKFAGVGGNVIYNKMLQSRHILYNTTVGFQRGGVFGGMSPFFIAFCHEMFFSFKWF